MTTWYTCATNFSSAAHCVKKWTSDIWRCILPIICHAIQSSSHMMLINKSRHKFLNILLILSCNEIKVTSADDDNLWKREILKKSRRLTIPIRIIRKNKKMKRRKPQDRDMMTIDDKMDVAFLPFNNHPRATGVHTQHEIINAYKKFFYSFLEEDSSWHHLPLMLRRPY